MITDTIQNALKRLFCSIGGNADNVRNKGDINAILDEMTALGIGKQIQDAAQSGGTTVIANPTLAGTEASLTGLQVGDTKYAVGGSSGGGVLVVNATTQDEGETYTLDQTWQAIHDADLAVINGLTTSAGVKSWAIVGSTDSLDHSLLSTEISMLDPLDLRHRARVTIPSAVSMANPCHSSNISHASPSCLYPS